MAAARLEPDLQGFHSTALARGCGTSGGTNRSQPAEVCYMGLVAHGVSGQCSNGDGFHLTALVDRSCHVPIAYPRQPTQVRYMCLITQSGERLIGHDTTTPARIDIVLLDQVIPSIERDVRVGSIGGSKFRAKVEITFITNLLAVWGKPGVQVRVS